MAGGGLIVLKSMQSISCIKHNASPIQDTMKLHAAECNDPSCVGWKRGRVALLWKKRVGVRSSAEAARVVLILDLDQRQEKGLVRGLDSGLWR